MLYARNARRRLSHERGNSTVPAVVALCSLTAIAACTGGDSTPVSAKDCGAQTPPVLAENGVGTLRVGMTSDDVYRYCQVLDDTTLQHGKEGMRERRMIVVVPPVTAVATMSAGLVWRIEVSSPRFRTLDSLGVGTTLAELRRSSARLAAGEGGAFVTRSDHCGLSFQLGREPVVVSKRLADIPDSARVTSILIVGCE
jgi:hypothetical protein